MLENKETKQKNKNKQTKQEGAPEVTAYLNKDCVCILWGMMAELICIDFLLDHYLRTYESNYIQNRVSFKFLSKKSKVFSLFSLLLPYQSSACKGNTLPKYSKYTHFWFTWFVFVAFWKT